MNFLERIKSQMYDPRNGRMGHGQLVRVDSSALSELVHHFESIDSYHRATHEGAKREHINEQLHNTIKAAYEQQGRNAEYTLMAIMDTLRPLMEERYKERNVKMSDLKIRWLS